MVAVIKVITTGSIATESVNTLHWRIPEANVSTEVAGILTAIDTFYETIDSYLAPQTFTIGSRVLTVDQSPNEEIFASALTCVTSGAATQVLSACAVVTYRGAPIGPRYRGRNFLGPLDNDAIATGGRLLDTTFRNTLITAMTTLGTTATNGVEFGIWSNKFQTFEPATVFSANPVLGTQRRRLH